MELIEAMKSVGTCRSFRAEPVPEAVLWRAVDVARFGPQGGNRQPVRFVIVRDEEIKRRLGELYLEQWEPYVRRLAAEAASVAEREQPGAQEPLARRRGQGADAFARAFGRHPAIVVVCAHLQSLLATDAELERLSIVGGASVYPIVQNFMLALRDQGVASALTTLLCAREGEVRELLAIPEEYATACHIAVGYPAGPFPRHLRRRPVEELAFLERFDGAALRMS
jgi:nitroreductase